MHQRFSVEICCHNPLVGHYFKAQESAKGVIVIAPAMGVEQKFYFDFADWLATQGFDVLTFDYRGIGLSLRQPLSKVQVSISEWVQQDCAYMIDKAALMAQDKPLYWLGHSLGGQVFAMIPNRHKVTRLITVASGSGYWRKSDPKVKALSLVLWFMLAPVATKLCGYFPGKQLGVVGNLPRQVIRQWRAWCLDPDYLVGSEGMQIRAQYQSLAIPITAIAFKDDELINYAGFEKLHSFYQSADKRHEYICPSQQNVARIGHFGFFRAQHQNTLWPTFISSMFS